MNAIDEKNQSGSHNTPESEARAFSPKGKQKKDGNGSGGVILLFFIIGLAASMIVGWVAFPKLLYSKKKQPIDFNHAAHMEIVEDGCNSCHFLREDGTFSGVPKLAQCIDCHDEQQGESEDEKVFVRQYVATYREVPWKIYSRQPDSVFFSHAAHIKLAKMKCDECHGPIGESTRLKIYEENRITGYSRDIWGKNMSGVKQHPWERMKMDDCTKCHVAKHVNQSSVQTEKGACFVCHK